MSWTWFHKLASPPHAYRILGSLAPWFGWASLVLILVATWCADSKPQRRPLGKPKTDTKAIQMRQNVVK